MVPQRIFAAMSVSAMHHRTDVFKEILRSARSGTRDLCRAKTDPIFLAGSGTAAMEAALLNVCRRGEKILVLNTGKFGERWSKIGKKLGLNVIELTAPIGECVEFIKIKEALDTARDIRAVCFQICETSAAIELPVPEITKLIKESDANILTIVDGVSAIGTRLIDVEDLQIDILASAGHKGLMLPPGLAILHINERAWSIIERNSPSSLYFDLNIERMALQKGTTAWTPAMNHIMGLVESLKMIAEEGEANVYRRHSLLAEGTRAAASTLGMVLMAAKGLHSSAVTGIYMPPGIDGENVRKEMLKEFKVRSAGGQDELLGKVIRIGHMGACRTGDIISGVSALENILRRFGNECSGGAAAAEAVFKREV